MTIQYFNFKMNFSKGDTVEWLADSFTNSCGYTIIKGQKYIVGGDEFSKTIYLKGIIGLWNSDNFILVAPRNEIINDYSIF